MAATKTRTALPTGAPPPPADGDTEPSGVKLRKLEFIETLFDRRTRTTDHKQTIYWDGEWIRIERAGKTCRLHPVGVLMGPELP